jgi:glycopeptide antibiotics resistance protein
MLLCVLALISLVLVMLLRSWVKRKQSGARTTIYTLTQVILWVYQLFAVFAVLMCLVWVWTGESPW